jgi:hypothetical protein
VRPGRVFVLRLQDGEFVHEVIERLALEQHIEAVSLRSGSENLNKLLSLQRNLAKLSQYVVCSASSIHYKLLWKC